MGRGGKGQRNHRRGRRKQGNGVEEREEGKGGEENGPRSDSILPPGALNGVTPLLLVSHYNNNYSQQRTQFNHVKLRAVCIRYSIFGNTKKILCLSNGYILGYLHIGV